MTRIGRRDSTHAAVVQALRAVGATVFDAGDIGRGFPDLVVGYHGHTWLIEVKGPAGRLTPLQEQFQQRWRGEPVHVVRTPAEALEVIGVAAR